MKKICMNCQFYKEISGIPCCSCKDAPFRDYVLGIYPKCSKINTDGECRFYKDIDSDFSGRIVLLIFLLILVIITIVGIVFYV